MDFQTYAPLAMRTARMFPDQRSNLRHAALGLLTELGEFATNVKRIVCYDKAMNEAMLANMIEEGGDTFWYVPLALFALGADSLPTPTEGQTASLPNDLGELVIFMSAMQGAISASLTSGPGLPIQQDRDVVLECLSGIVFAMDKAATLIGSSGDEMRSLNIAKLRQRFPVNFSTQAAEGRADKGGLSASES